MDDELSGLMEHITKICQNRSITNIELYDSKERLEVQVFFKEEPSLPDKDLNRIPVRNQ